MRDVAVVGVGMTRFGKLLERTNKDLVREAVEQALGDAGIGKERIAAAYVGYPRFRQKGIVPRQDRPVVWFRPGAEGAETDL